MKSEIENVLLAQNELLTAMQKLVQASSDLIKKERDQSGRFITAKEYADTHGCALTSVYRWFDDGLLEGKKVGHKRFVLIKDQRYIPSKKS